MKISLQWLKDYVSFEISTEDLAHRMTMAGLEVEEISDVNGDKVFELEITPNRPDCLSMFGMARELSAILNEDKQFPVVNEYKDENECSITIEDTESCAAYIGTLIKEVNISSTDTFLKSRIEALGLRSINNVVDITNFCLMEIGQPLHAFDYDKLKGGEVIVRRAKKGEKIVTIDDVERELDESILIIADEERPVAIAGVMGGKDTEVTSFTKNILLESAYFDPMLIRRTSRKLGLSSDSSYRFERGVDFANVELGANRAIDLILEYAKGRVTARKNITAVDKTNKYDAVEISLERINSYLGGSFSAERCVEILERLDMKVEEADGVFKVTPHTYRDDIKRDVDLIEEIGRIEGYDNLPMSLPSIVMENVKSNPRPRLRNKIRQQMSGLGVDEVMTFSLLNRSAIQDVNIDDKTAISVINPLSQDQEMMRPSLVPCLLNVIKTNINRGQKNLKIYETGRIYLPEGEKEILGIALTGKRNDDWCELKKESVGYYDAKGIVQSVLHKMDISNIVFKKENDIYFAENEAAAIYVNDQKIGSLGKINEDVSKKFDIKNQAIFFAKIDLEYVYAQSERIVKYVPVSEYPAVTRDISLAVKKEVEYQQVLDIINSINSDILKDISFSEQYLGDKIPAGTRGIIFSLTYQLADRTLVEEEVSSVHDSVCQSLVNQLQAIKR